MAYSAQIVSRARQQLTAQKDQREAKLRQNLQQAYKEQPRLLDIDRQLRRSMTVAAQTVFTQGGDPREAMEQVRKENLALQAERAQLIADNFAPDFLDENPACPKCGDAGYVGSTMCSCLRQLCAREQKQSLYKLLGAQMQFADFRLDYYPEQIDRSHGVSPRKIMELTLRLCRDYANGFQEGIGNLLFVGNTGLGKTMLSACIADTVTDKGYSVVYESAPQLFAKLEKNRFDPDDQSRAAAAEYAGCDLLIIDDLGTEMPGNFVTAALYALLNDRLLANKSMIISTNLNIEEIAKRYSPQIASRMQGSFRGLTFVGEDIRVLKSRGK